MNARDFNKRIRFEAPGGKDPEYGTPTDAWVKVVEVGAKVEDSRPSKSNVTQQGLRLGRNAATVWIRNREGINSTMRIVELDGLRRTLSITGGPASIVGGRYLEMTVEAFST